MNNICMKKTYAIKLELRSCIDVYYNYEEDK